jgi:hypothetical protein
MKQLALSLPMVVTLKERNVIHGFKNVKTTGELGTLINSLPFDNSTMMFLRLAMTIYGSRMLSDGKMIHYKKCTASIPTKFDSDSSQATHFLLVVLSLRRTLLLNYKKLKAPANICESDSIQFLTSSSTDVQYRPDSQDSYDDSENDSSEAERSDPGWEEHERLRRLNDMIKEVKEMRFDDDVMTVDDWEELFST